MTRAVSASRFSGLSVIAGAFLLSLLLLPGIASAQSSAPPDATARAQELEAAWKAGQTAAAKGPAEVSLIDQGNLSIPADYAFIPKREGMRIMRALGNTVREQPFVGLVLGTRPTDRWIVVITFIKEGYVKDDDAKNWNADELLQSLKDGTEAANKDRVARGFPELEVLGWVERPTYDADMRRLVWSARIKRKNVSDTTVTGVNYNTYALGRDGYFSVNLLTNSDRVDTDKRAAHELLADLSYNNGKRYEDFNSSTDHIAAYGLAALIAGVAAKKLGLLALIGVFAVKFAKLIVVGVGIALAGIAKFFRRKPSAG